MLDPSKWLSSQAAPSSACPSISQFLQTDAGASTSHIPSSRFLHIRQTFGGLLARLRLQCVSVTLGRLVSASAAFFCAIPPAMRPEWAKRYSELVRPGGVLITLMFPIGGCSRYGEV
jgi:hypothetical protein